MTAARGGGGWGVDFEGEGWERRWESEVYRRFEVGGRGEGGEDGAALLWLGFCLGLGWCWGRWHCVRWWGNRQHLFSLSIDYKHDSGDRYFHSCGGREGPSIKAPLTHRLPLSRKKTAYSK